MSQFTQQERIALNRIFPIHDHEIRQGESSKSGDRIRWYIYIKKEPLIERLDDVFFGEWENGFVFRDSTPTSAHVGMHLTIRGIRREFDGYNSGTGDNDDEAIFKGSSTDAFKRVVALWGPGNYIKDAPQVWTDNWKVDKKPDWDKKKRVEAEAWAKFAEWLRSIGAAGDVPATTPPVASVGYPQPQPPATPAWAQDPAPSSSRQPVAPFPAGKTEVIRQVEEYLDQHGVTMAQCLAALKLKSPEGLPPNFEVARKLIDAKMLSLSAEAEALESDDKLDKKELPF